MTGAWPEQGWGAGAVLCPQGHANRPHYTVCSQCGAPIGVVPVPEDADDPVVTSSTRRRGWMIGSIAAVVVVIAGVTGAYLLAVAPADEPTSGDGSAGFGSSAASAAPVAVTCDEPPIVQAESMDLSGDGLTVGAAFFAGCPGDDSEAASAVRITVAAGERDIAAGVFDFSTAPLQMKAGVPDHHTLVFPGGMYWRTPEMVGSAPELIAHHLTGSPGVRSVSGSGEQRLVAVAPAAPEHGSVDGVAAAVLAELRDADLPYLLDAVVNGWVPQVSSKRAGLVVGNRTFTDADVLRDHLDYRRRFDGARLVYSGQWSTFADPDWWVTVVGPAWYFPADANNWCDTHGFGADGCFAKFISPFFGPERATVYRK